jgi:hypothetical protein
VLIPASSNLAENCSKMDLFLIFNLERQLIQTSDIQETVPLHQLNSTRLNVEVVLFERGGFPEIK